jgi:vancomycin resistance protein VanJ
LASIAAALLYVLGLFAWYGLHRIVGDASPLLYSLNALALYVFLPLPLVLLAAALLRRREVLVAFVAGAALWLHLWGALFWPPASPAVAADKTLTVMTYNVFGFNLDPASVVETVRRSGADVVAFQELNPEVADAIATELQEEYPFQHLQPADGVMGMGVISREPATLLPSTLDHPLWIGDPQLLSLEHEGTQVLVLNVHAIAQPRFAAERLEQAQLVAGFAAGRREPLVVLGDFNASSTNDAIETLTKVLKDAWREAGSGFGHTFPGASVDESPGSSRPKYLGIDVPRWLIRIDYVFHSSEWRTVAARTGGADSKSDHRPVIATLVLKE